jgi:hypothetical protein
MSVALAKFGRYASRTPGTPPSPTGELQEKIGATVSVSDASSDLAHPDHEKRFFFQRQKKYDPDAIATLVQ